MRRRPAAHSSPLLHLSGQQVPDCRRRRREHHSLRPPAPWLQQQLPDESQCGKQRQSEENQRVKRERPQFALQARVLRPKQDEDQQGHGNAEKNGAAASENDAVQNGNRPHECTLRGKPVIEGTMRPGYVRIRRIGARNACASTTGRIMRISRHPLKQFLFLLLLLPAFAVAEQQAEIPELKPQPQQALVEQLVATYTSRLHFASRELDDKLSSEVFERYLEMLDPSKVYFTRDDIAGFEKHRHVIDDALKSGRVDVAYDIYNTLLKRMVERIASIDVLLQKEPDFSVDEYFEFDRRDADWQTAAELDEYWRKRIKNEALRLMLADKTWDETRELLSKRYSNFRRRVAQVNSGDVFDLFINAYAQTLDPHTMYFSPRDSEEFEIRMSLSYEGIGASLQMEDEYVTIMNTIPGGAAHRSGELKPKDRITAVGEGDDGEMTDVVGWRLDEVVDLIRGPKDTVVRLQILPAGAAPGTSERVISLVRSAIKLEEQAAQASVLEVPEGEHSRKLGVIKVPAFYLDFRGKVSGREDYRSTTRDVRRLIGELKEKGVDGLILDLRYNGGGSLQEAAELTGLFIDQGPVVQIRASAGPKEVIEDVEPGVAWDGPLVVLVNRFSASASEIFAGAIQDYGRGLVVGTRTFGKGTVQHL